MRLLLLNQFYVPDISPTAHLAESLVHDRVARGDLVTVVTGRGSYVKVEGRVRKDITNPRVCRIWTPGLGKANLVRRLADYAFFYLGAAFRVLTLPPQEIIVSMTTPPYIALVGLIHKMIHPRARLVLWSMDCYPEMFELAGVIRSDGIATRVLRWLNRRIFRRLDHLVCLDEAMASLLSSRYASGSRPPTSVIPNWELSELYHGPVADGMRSSGRLRILYLGNTGYGHEFETLLAAAAVLRNAPVEFAFFGGGSRWRALEKAREERGLTNLMLCGYVPKEETPAVMRAADCALITLRREALGLMSPSKLHASLAMGLPIIYVGPSGSNVDEAVKRFNCGFSIQNGDAEGLVAAIRGLIAKPEHLGELARKARRAFEEAYCETSALPRFDAVLRRLDLPREAV
jgi:glycosyltransferase involved in cell wall biosynthesis